MLVPSRRSKRLTKEQRLQQQIEELEVQEVVNILVAKHCFKEVVDALVNNLEEKLSEAELLQKRLQTIKGMIP